MNKKIIIKQTPDLLETELYQSVLYFIKSEKEKLFDEYMFYEYLSREGICAFAKIMHFDEVSNFLLSTFKQFQDGGYSKGK